MDEYQSLSHTKWDCKYHVIVRYERNRCSLSGSDASSKMRVGPSKSGLQEQTSNRLKLRGLRVLVVSVEEKAEQHFVRCESRRRTQVNR